MPAIPARHRENRVRIIGGQWRGRKLAFPDGEGLRPTGDRLRETLFNWLMPVLPGAQCLDLFAGSGALGFEALSRGAAACVLVEKNAGVCRALRDARDLLGAQQAVITHADSSSWLATTTGRWDIVFIDPPFSESHLQPGAIVSQMDARNLLVDDPWIYVEQPADSPPSVPAGFASYRQQRAGNVLSSLWRRQQNLL